MLAVMELNDVIVMDRLRAACSTTQDSNTPGNKVKATQLLHLSRNVIKDEILQLNHSGLNVKFRFWCL